MLRDTSTQDSLRWCPLPHWCTGHVSLGTKPCIGSCVVAEKKTFECHGGQLLKATLQLSEPPQLSSHLYILSHWPGRSTLACGFHPYSASLSRAVYNRGTNVMVISCGHIVKRIGASWYNAAFDKLFVPFEEMLHSLWCHLPGNDVILALVSCSAVLILSVLQWEVGMYSGLNPEPSPSLHQLPRTNLFWR